MGTRAQIAVVCADGTVNEVVVNYDGYIRHVGRILYTHYNTVERAAAVTSLGDISVLAESIECPANHTFNSPVAGHTVFYGRDRKESGLDTNRYPNVEAFKQFQDPTDPWEYAYLFVDNQWQVSINGSEYYHLGKLLEADNLV